MPGTGLDKLSSRKAEKELSPGISAYEDGDYKGPSRLLQSVLASEFFLKSDKVAAPKYRAFIHCAQSREKACREAFRKAWELDPKFELTPAESGPTV